MEVQCPQCRAVYRIRQPLSAPSSIRVSCPNCQQHFLVKNQPSSVLEHQQPERILIVDDARFFRELLCDLLADRSAELISAATAKEAWQLLQQTDISLMIVDINLPEVNGLQLIRKIRQHEKLKEIKILCVSGVYRQEDDVLKALRAGADDFISKSFNPDELNLRIDKLLAL
ncbi:MAG: zinc-ribbon domain-containing protein [Desulfuromonadales bacterium]|nr:zinc-ribbon domain-containing protein [Desulfuromonadales bacterium]